MYLSCAAHLTVQSEHLAGSVAVEGGDKAAHIVIVQDISHVHLAHLHMLRGIIIISAHVVTVQDISHVHLAHLHTFYAALFIIAHM